MMTTAAAPKKQGRVSETTPMANVGSCSEREPTLCVDHAGALLGERLNGRVPGRCIGHDDLAKAKAELAGSAYPKGSSATLVEGVYGSTVNMAVAWYTANFAYGDYPLLVRPAS